MTADTPRRFFFTVDVDWVPGSEAGLTGLYDFCTAHVIRGTYFITGRMAVEYPALMRAGVESGHELGTHGWEHGQNDQLNEENFDSAPYERQREWMQRATDAVERASGVRPMAFRAPNLKVSETTFRVLQDLKYRYDSSVPARRLTVTYGKVNSPRYYWAPLNAYHPSMGHLARIGSSSVIEIPPSAFFVPLNVSALRIFGLAAVLWAVRRIAKRSQDLVFFSHPSEFVPAHQQVLAPDNPPRHMRGIGPENYDLLSRLVRYVQSLGYEATLFADVRHAPSHRHIG